jgi:alkylation response protein AidB-like acyl-CoA dehydrogenase
MSETIDAIKDVCKGISSQVNREYIAACGRKKEAPVKLMQAMADGGLFAIGVPEEFGGAGGGVTEVCVMLDELGKSGLLGPRIVTSQMARTTIARHGSEEQKKRFLPPTATGEKYFSFAVTEAGAGTNSFLIKTTAAKDGDSYVINGEKAFITGIHEADWCLLIARTSKFDAAEKRSGISVFVIDPRTDGITIKPMDIGLHMPDKSSMVYLDNVRVPAENLIGAEGAGLEALFDCLNPERLMSAAINVGLSDYLLNKAADYARERAPFGKPIGTYQGVAHPLAIAKARTDACRALTYQAAAEYDAGQDAEVASDSVKFLGAEALKISAEAAMNTFGGSSVDLEVDLIPFLLWGKFCEIAPLNNNVVLSSIARSGLGLPKSH